MMNDRDTSAAAGQQGEAACATDCPLTGLGGFVLTRDPETGVDRRTFIARSVLATAAMALAAACGGADSAAGPAFSGTYSLKLSDYPTLANVNGVALVTANGSPIAVVRTSTSNFIALSRVCPHEGGLIGQSGNGFLCPVHGAQFSLTGTWLGGQRTSSMRSYSTSYDATAGTVTIG